MLAGTVLCFVCSYPVITGCTWVKGGFCSLCAVLSVVFQVVDSNGEFFLKSSELFESPVYLEEVADVLCILQAGTRILSCIFLKLFYVQLLLNSSLHFPMLLISVSHHTLKIKLVYITKSQQKSFHHLSDRTCLDRVLLISNDGTDGILSKDMLFVLLMRVLTASADSICLEFACFLRCLVAVLLRERRRLDCQKAVSVLLGYACHSTEIVMVAKKEK